MRVAPFNEAAFFSGSPEGSSVLAASRSRYSGLSVIRVPATPVPPLQESARTRRFPGDLVSCPRNNLY
jgi:hypothetical protein